MKHSPAPYWREITLTAPPYDEFKSINDNAPFITAHPTGNGLDALHLMNAAPDLLEACKAMIRYEDSRSVSASSYTGAIVLIRSAIAKAEGR